VAQDLERDRAAAGKASVGREGYTAILGTRY
jgi:hypothetical protein